MKNKQLNRIATYSALTLIVCEIILMLISWLLTATMTDGVASLLSAEGIRFLLGNFSQNVSTPQLVWILLLSMAYGSVRQSGLYSSMRSDNIYRKGLALKLTFAVGIVLLVVLLFLTVQPHAVLLSSTGRLWPSPFSRALVPVLSGYVIILAVIYGTVTRRFTTFESFFSTLSYGIRCAAPLFFLYLLAAQLYSSFCFVF